MIEIGAAVSNGGGEHSVQLSTNGNAHAIHIPAKDNGQGSRANGGELLFLALATCYCNDIYREANRRNIKVHHVLVEVQGMFAPEAGSIAENVRYIATVKADAPDETIRDLMKFTDTVAEIQNTLRAAVPVELVATTTLNA